MNISMQCSIRWNEKLTHSVNEFVRHPNERSEWSSLVHLKGAKRSSVVYRSSERSSIVLANEVSGHPSSIRKQEVFND
jgi:hypothetical protein